MLFALDIDSTIAVDRNGYARYLNNALELGIEEAAIQNLESYQKFTAMPQVQKFRASEENEQRYQEMYKAADHDLEVIFAMEPITDAIRAVNNLAEDGTVIYVSCRRVEETEVTRIWLTKHGFPSPENVYICQQYYHKYIHAYAVAKPGEPIILIDDMAEKIVPAFRTLAKQEKDIAISLVRRLAVVAIDQEEPPIFNFKVPFPVIALRSWSTEDLEQLKAK
jgi:hypothetical protein